MIVNALARVSKGDVVWIHYSGATYSNSRTDHLVNIAKRMAETLGLNTELINNGSARYQPVSFKYIDDIWSRG